MDIHDHYIEGVLNNVEAGMHRSLPMNLPSYHTVEPYLRDTTTAIAALDGTDQQIFHVPYSPELGIAAWGVLYVEFDPSNPSEVYRDGPTSEGFLFTEDLLYYHITLELPDLKENLRFRNDFHVIRQTLSSSRPIEPPIFKNKGQKLERVRSIAAVERGTGEWLALKSAVTHQLNPGGLMLKDGRFNCQLEQAASWVDDLGRCATRNNVRCVAIVKSGKLYGTLAPIVRTIAKNTNRAFYFLVPSNLIQESYADTQTYQKTLMAGGKDHTDLAGIGALWTAFCPDPQNPMTFVILEFNLYDLQQYRQLAYEPKTLRSWQEILKPLKYTKSDKSSYIIVTDLIINELDIELLVEPTLRELLWLCEREVAQFGYPNLLGIAHKEVKLTTAKTDLIRQKFREAFCETVELLDELVDSSLDADSHKLHNI